MLITRFITRYLALLTCLPAWVCMALISGCVSTPSPSAPPGNDSALEPGQNIEDMSAPAATPHTEAIQAPAGQEIALRAIALVGTPYRYGGADLHGFDCSGMVYYLHRELGFNVPRTAAEQARAAEPVERQHLQPGDLLFFKIRRGKGISHVGVYVGDNHFVHAPQSGKRIELRQLDDAYYAARFTGAGRLIATP